MIKLLCIIEVRDAETEQDAQKHLDAFRESVLPSKRHGLTIYRATDADMQEPGDLHPMRTQ